MKTTTKVAIGFSIAAVAGITATVIASGKIIEKVHYATNRCKARKFVENKFGGNQKIMDLVDRLSDEDLESIITVSGKIKNGKQKVKIYGQNFKGSQKDLKNKLSSYLSAAFEG
ncbi:hypothetical protein [Enterococcus sp. HY326]|uniref:hypothetical protein n=1 Tax=Enterococcus sp. HY326 TaxID=2971265 RepID=UPI0022402281|nr:hypothetical protein [Enterococcus sp. HY326]